MEIESLAIALVECIDRKGIISAVSGWLAAIGSNIIQVDEYAGVDGQFFMRLAFSFDGTRHDLASLEAGLCAVIGGISTRQGSVRVYNAQAKPAMGILVSKADHCLVELLYRQHAGELPVSIPFVASNHPQLASLVESYGIPFYHVPVTKETKPQAEAKLLELAQGQTDFLVLARYMQIVSGDFITRYGRDIINIHHSFLPSFAGAEPYRQAWERGVKLIGATAHYVTEQLDEGPIIEQVVERVSHRDDIETLKRKGKSLERQALYQAILAHAERRVIRYCNKTIVFA